MCVERRGANLLSPLAPHPAQSDHPPRDRNGHATATPDDEGRVWAVCGCGKKFLLDGDAAERYRSGRLG